MKFPVVLFTCLLTGCVTVTTNIAPPYADPKGTVAFATIHARNELGNPSKVMLVTLDGKFSVYEPTLIGNGATSGDPVETMYVLPGLHVVRPFCYKSANDERMIIADLELTFQAGESYIVRCHPSPDSEKASFSVSDGNGNSVPFRNVKWVRPGSGQ